jgi:hypothetical protein
VRFFRPRIAEIDIDPVDFPALEQARQKDGVRQHEPDIRQVFADGALHRHDKRFRYAFYADEQRVRRSLCRLGQKASLAAADLQIQLVVTAERLKPPARTLSGDGAATMAQRSSRCGKFGFFLMRIEKPPCSILAYRARLRNEYESPADAGLGLDGNTQAGVVSAAPASRFIRRRVVT